MATSGRSPSSEHLPEMLDRIATAISTRDESMQPMKGAANRHAVSRFRAGYRLREVVTEFRVLRRVLARELMREPQRGRPSSGALELMHDVIDKAVTNAVDEYTSELERTRNLFISILTHDLAQPLNAVHFGAQALADAAAPTSSEYHTASLVRSSAARMRAMVDELLEFARNRAGDKMPITPGPVDVRSLIDRVTEEVALAHPFRTVQCLAEQSADGHWVEWDASRVMQALSNVLTNAVIHGEDPIVVVGRREGDLVFIEISNRGEIPSDVLPRLFEPFTGGRARKGLGLGLYIVERVVSAHGGTVQAQCREGVTTMRIALPCRPPTSTCVQ